MCAACVCTYVFVADIGETDNGKESRQGYQNGSGASTAA